MVANTKSRFNGAFAMIQEQQVRVLWCVRNVKNHFVSFTIQTIIFGFVLLIQIGVSATQIDLATLYPS